MKSASTISAKLTLYNSASRSPAPGVIGARRAAGNPRQLSLLWEGVLVAAVLSVIALIIHGYHPYAEDGGLYFTSVLKTMHPELFPVQGQFSAVLTRYTLFAPMLSWAARISGLSIGQLFFLLYIASMWATLFAAWLIALRCFDSKLARYGAITLLALWLTMPIAGTSLLLMDPYVTARSISTPCGLFAIAAMIDVAGAARYGSNLPWKSIIAGSLCLILAALVHPLMSGYLVACVALLFSSSLPEEFHRRWSVATLCLIGVAGAGAVAWGGSPTLPVYATVAHTRAYWFLQDWRWFEVAGLIGPLLILSAFTRVHTQVRPEARWLARMAVAAGVTAVTISVLFIREASHSYSLARLQPLRIFHPIYIVMVIFVGAYAGERLLRRSVLHWAVMVVALGGIMMQVQRQTFPASIHIELPGIAPKNQWEQAFLWARNHTPRDDAFAMDANYINEPGEDAQYFRAIAERSALPDRSKDGGLAAIEPQLAGEWAAAQAAQTGLEHLTDEVRRERLRGFPVQWIVLSNNAATGLKCPFRNSAVKICHMTQ